MQDTIYIRDELVFEAHRDPDHPYILLRQLGEPGDIRAYPNEVRYLADALYSMAGLVPGNAPLRTMTKGGSRRRWDDE